MSLLLNLIGKKKVDNKIASNKEKANIMFPDKSYVHTAERMQETLDQGQLPPSQYRWNTRDNGARDELPWRLSPQHWSDMLSTQEGLTEEQVNQLNADYYKMNYLPDVMNTSKNIDILIEAAKRDDKDIDY
jgi:hypothetical protein